MGGEQRESVNALRQVGGTGPGQRQAIKGAGAAPHFVHQHQTLRGGVVQNIGGFGHFHHKGRAAAGDVIRGAHTGKNPVDRTQLTTLRRHVAADVRQQHNEGDLTHIGGFTAHVGAGNDLHIGTAVEPGVVGHERVGDQIFHHRMAALFNIQHGVIG